MGAIGSRGCTPVAPYALGGTCCCGTAGCALNACGLASFVPLGVAGLGGTVDAIGFAALGELRRVLRLGLLRAAFSALARRSCSACAAMAAYATQWVWRCASCCADTYTVNPPARAVILGLGCFASACGVD